MQAEESQDPPLDSFPQVGYCSECYEPQYKTPSGEVCENGHGGAPTLDEVPVCEQCSADLKPGAKFCDECGASTEPKPEQPDDVKLCPGCESEVDPSARFCPDCGQNLTKPVEKEEKTTVKKPEKKEDEPAEKSVRIPEKKEDKPKEKTVKKREQEEEEDEVEEQPEEKVDLSAIDPEKEWECFGMIEPDHQECKTCAYRERCAEKAGVEL